MSSRDSYDGPAVDTNDEVEPGLYGELGVLVPQHLKAIGRGRSSACGLFRVETRNEAVDGTEHACHGLCS